MKFSSLYFCINFFSLIILSVNVFAQPSPVSETLTQTSTSDKNNEVSFTLENSLNLRDPFRRFSPKLNASVDEGGKIPELERYELDKFKLIGIITGPKKNKALVLAIPTNRMEVVSEGMRLGTRRGLVKKITPNAIRVEEKLVNLLGQDEVVETMIEFDRDKVTSAEVPGDLRQHEIMPSSPYVQPLPSARQ